MTHFESVTIRAVEASDLDTFYVHQLDAEANRMAAFVGKDPANRAAFDAYWARNLQAAGNLNRTIVADGLVVGHIACFPQEGELEVTYWLGREYWGRGIATRALGRLLEIVTARPIFARTATDNFGSLRVLQRCGFTIVGRDRGFAHGRGAITEEYCLRLDSPETTG